MKNLLLLITLALIVGCKKEEKAPSTTPSGLFTYMPVYLTSGRTIVSSSWVKVNSALVTNFQLGASWAPPYPADYVQVLNFAIGDTISWKIDLDSTNMVGWGIIPPSNGNYWGTINLTTDSAYGITHTYVVGATDFIEQ